VQEQLLQFVKWGDNWDSYGAPSVTWDASMFALSILSDVMRPRTPMPQVVPTSNGVQLEWHEKGIDLELHITGPYQCDLWFQDQTRPDVEPIEIELTNDLSALVEPIGLLTQR
jgi:hypothetical protein